MVDTSGIGQSVQRLAEKATQEGAKQPESAKGGDVARFEAAMKTGGESAQPVSQPGGQSVPEAAKTTGPERPGTPGDRMLKAIDSMRSAHKEAAESVQRAVQSDPGTNLSPQELLKSQVALQKVVMTEELVSKAASKTTQNIDTLLKSQ